MIRLFLIAFAALLVSCVQQPPYYGPPGGGPSPYPPQQPPVYTPIPQPPQTGGRMCGGMVASQGPQCGAGEFCYRTVEAQCGAADQPGVCRVRPEVCTQDYTPVCGCDGRTYSNECAANGNGVSAAYRGECRNTPTPPPSNTMCPQVYQPVCGTDGRTYSNGCMAGDVPIAYQGECRTY